MRRLLPTAKRKMVGPWIFFDHTLPGLQLWLALPDGDEETQPSFHHYPSDSSRKERIEQAKRDWVDGRFPKVPGDEAKFIPLP